MSFLQYCAYFARFESLFMQIGRYKSQWILCCIFLSINNSHGVLVPSCLFFDYNSVDALGQLVYLQVATQVKLCSFNTALATAFRAV